MKKPGPKKTLFDVRQRSFLLDKATDDKLTEWAGRLDVSKSEIVRRLINSAPEPGGGHD